MEPNLEVVYVTVGTTQFKALIDEITSDSALRVLKSRGCRKLIIQSGCGAFTDANAINSRFGIEVEQFRFKYDPMHEDIQKANLVIGHAGAGTCMDILSAGKPGLIVINTSLMNNHQHELALQLAEERYVYYCDVSGLVENLRTIDVEALQPYDHQEAAKNLNSFVECLNEMIYPAIFE